MIRFLFGSGRVSTGDIYADFRRQDEKAAKEAAKEARKQEYQRKNADQVIQVVTKNPDGTETQQITYVYNKKS